MPGYPVILFAGTTVGGQTFHSEPVSVQDTENLALRLRVTGAIGTSPTLDVTIEHSNNPYDKDANWETLGSAFSQKTAAGVEDKNFTTTTDKMMSHVRAKYVIGGTNPAFTFRLTGVARD